MRVWIATGILMSRFNTDAVQALSLLRAYAWSHEQDLDDVTEALIAGLLDPSTIGH